MSLNLNAYVMNEQQEYAGPALITSMEEFAAFLKINVTNVFEIRVVDPKDDSIVFHVVNQTLVFPIPAGGSVNNKWDVTTQRFITTGVVTPESLKNTH